MGMFSTLQKKAPNATISFLSAKMRPKKNCTVSEYLDRMGTQTRDDVVKFATTRGQKQRDTKRAEQVDVHAELSRRIAAKKHQKEMKERKHLEKKLNIFDKFEICITFVMSTVHPRTNMEPSF